MDLHFQHLQLFADMAKNKVYLGIKINKINKEFSYYIFNIYNVSITLQI